MNTPTPHRIHKTLWPYPPMIQVTPCRVSKYLHYISRFTYVCIYMCNICMSVWERNPLRETRLTWLYYAIQLHHNVADPRGCHLRMYIIFLKTFLLIQLTIAQRKLWIFTVHQQIGNPKHVHTPYILPTYCRIRTMTLRTEWVYDDQVKKLVEEIKVSIL